MLRTQISLTEQERRVLDTASAQTGRSISALIRDAVDAMYGDQRSAADDLAAMRQAFGCWTDRNVDGESWVQELRSGRRLEQLR
ncbi:MAG: ribbon-helix-helix protein, CopG family [Geodermatophilaceae bacterium]|nr:ribbon-helix-helix protein, CopG family [Geodermatophilaceae bacterium]